MRSYKKTLAVAVISSLALAAIASAKTSSSIGVSSNAAVAPAAIKAPASAPHKIDTTRIANLYNKIPLTFERNDGQSDSQVKFLSRGPGYSLFLTERSAVLAIPEAAESKTTPVKADMTARKAIDSKVSVLRVDLAGSRRPTRIEGEDLQGSVSNYFVGKDRTKWRSAIPNYGQVKYEGVYPGIDLAYHGNPNQLEYDFTVAPGADPRAIQLEFAGADKLAINWEGDLVIALDKAKVIEHAPVIYQEIGGKRRSVSGRYALQGKNRAAFQIAQYDRSQPLVIDPTLVYSTYVGCCQVLGYNFVGQGMAIDAGGSAYVAGSIDSASFPTTTGAYTDGSSAGFAVELFVSKLTADGSGLVYSTIFGAGTQNSGSTYGDGIAVDADGNAYVTGYTSSTDFPTTAGAYQGALVGGANAFVTKLNPSGTGLIYSTYLGGNNVDLGIKIAVDADGDAYVTGFTQSSNFPHTAGAFQAALGGFQNAFVTELNPAGTGLVYSTYLGGNNNDAGNNIAIDSSGDAYVTGYTSSSNFPHTAGAFQTTFQATLPGTQYNGFVTQLNPAGSGLVYSTYLGGNYEDEGTGIAVDDSGDAYISGFTGSSNFPTTAGAFQTSNQEGCDPIFCGDGFVTKLNPTGSGLIYSTLLGGNGGDIVTQIAIDENGNAYLAGDTSSNNFPVTTDAYQSSYGGGCSTSVATCLDGFVANLSADGTQLLYSTYFGGTTGAQGVGTIALDSESNFYISGDTGASDFPTTTGAYQTGFVGTPKVNGNTFVSKFELANTGSGSNMPVEVTTGNPVVPSADLTFFIVSMSGLTTVTTSSTGPALPPNYAYGSQPAQIDVNTTASFSGAAGLCFNYEPSNFADPSLIRLLHFENGSWLDVTVSNDTTNGVICGSVGSFSPFTIAQGPSTAGQTPTKASVATTFGLGTAPVGDTAIKSLNIKNTGHATLFVNTISSSNPAEFAAAASPCPSGVAPLQTCMIPINFSPVGVGARSATLTLTTNAGVGSQNVALVGTGSIDATVRPSTFSIYYTKFGSSVLKGVTVYNRQTNAVALNNYVSGPNASDFKITGGSCGSTLAAKTSCLVDVTYKPGILGAESAQLNVTDKPDSLGPYAVSFNVAGTIPELVTPLTLSYGTVSQASSRMLKAIVTNKSPFAISVSSSTSGPNGADFTITGGTCSGTLAANSSCTVAVTFKPTSAASESAMLAVAVPQDPSSPHNVNLIGTGM